MAIFVGNFSSKFLSRLQHRVFSIPWAKKSGSIKCMKSRDYGSSVPIRYIPKKSSKIDKLEDVPQVKKGLEENDKLEDVPQVKKGSEENEIRSYSFANALRKKVSHGGRNAQTSILLDEKFHNENQNQMPMSNLMFDSETELEEKIDHGLEVVENEVMKDPEEAFDEFRIHQEKDFHKRDVLQAGNTKEDAQKLAVELLATRAYTAFELRKKLQGRRFPLVIVEAVTNEFRTRGLINDSLYAEMFARSRFSYSSWGQRRIKQALFKKGISEVDAVKAVKLVFEDNESVEDQDSHLGMSKLAMDHLFVQASKQWLRGQDVPRETRKSRIIRWLQYRGFNWGVISIILKKLDSHHSHHPP